jgi:2-polyprenyl-6-methoxyphenol hydroxylase-like FAD-dependent oxidoreductase
MMSLGLVSGRCWHADEAIMKTHETEVLIVGAGPVGLLTAIILSEAGIKVEIIDREERAAARSYACALHPSSLELLDEFGLGAALLEQGRRINRIAFYDGAARKSETDFLGVSGKFPFLLVLPQSELEEMLESRLKESGVKVKWNQRLDDLQTNDDSVSATVEELEGTAMGYIVPHWETMVKRRSLFRTRFLIGADGHHSKVRRCLGVDYEQFSRPETFVACEFSSDTTVLDEVRVVLDESTTNVFWPLPNNRLRWTFQLIHSETEAEFPEKERRAVRTGEIAVNERIRRNLLRLCGIRAPWFSAEIDEILWCKQVAFEKGLASVAGVDRTWLVGDAAHQTGPVGVQSLNAGLSEAHALARCIQQISKGDGSLDLLSEYGRDVLAEWTRLLGAHGGLRPVNPHVAWLERRATRMLPCLPAVEKSLPILAGKLGLQFVSSNRAATQAAGTVK